MSQHWQAEAGFKVGPGVGDGEGADGWTDFSSDFGNAFVGFVVERFFEVDAADEEVPGSRIEFDDYSFFSEGSELKDITNFVRRCAAHSHNS